LKISVFSIFTNPFVQIGTVTADNASSILKAFKIDWNEKSPNQSSESQTTLDLEEFIEDSEDDSDWEDEDSELESVELEMDEELMNLDMVGIDEEDITEVPGVCRNSCLAHLLQLAIKQPFTLNTYVRKLIGKVNSIVAFFSRSTHWRAKLKNKSGGLRLIKPCSTRWNSQYHCIKRMCRKIKGNVEDGAEVQ
jgi:hypothetical protein